jgi:hypothetical protein
VYLKGFYEGKMLVGELVGKSVQEAKPLIKQQLLDRGQAVVYMEPEKTIISRSEIFPVFVDSHWFHCGSGSSFLSQCGSRFRIQEPCRSRSGSDPVQT